MCAHAWELFVITDGLPIAEYSEQSIESWNKFIRAYKSGPAAKARQMSIKMNTKDIFQRMMIKTHPAIALKKRQLFCDSCKQLGHTVRSCKINVPYVENAEEAQTSYCHT